MTPKLPLLLLLSPFLASSQTGFSPLSMDRTADPCVDFYQYACGGWLKANPVPADQASWGRFNELEDRNRDVLRRILDRLSVNDPKRTPIEQKIGDFYQSCMDETSINKAGLVPLKPELDRIAAIPAKSAIVDVLIRLQRRGVTAFFNFGSGPDFKNASQVIAQLSQGGLGLPDRDYYLKPDAKSVELRQK